MLYEVITLGGNVAQRVERRKISRQTVCTDTVGLQALDRGLEPTARTAGDDQHRRARQSQRARDGFADARAATGYQRAPPVELV